MKKFYLFLLVLLSGCATSEGYNRILNTWLDSDKQNLLESWGVPTSTYKLNDHIEYFSYLRTSISSIDGNVYSLKYDKITSWKYDGNNCEACNEDFWGSLCKIF